MTFDVTKRAKRFWSGKVWAAGFFGFFFLMVIAWTVFWQIAANATDKTLNSWMDREAKSGHLWTCPEKNISGYPFWIEISCAKPGFNGEFSGKTFHGTLAGFHAFASLFQPREINAAFQAPFSAQSETGHVSLVLDWTNLELTLEGKPQSLQYFLLQSRDLRLEGTFAGTGPYMGKAGKLDLFFTRVNESGGAFEFGLTVKNLTSPELEKLLTSSVPADLELKGIITAFDLSRGGDAIEKIEAWRTSGGKLDFDTAQFEEGALALSAKGQLGLDPAHRLEGKLDTQLTGFGPILRHFGINPVFLDAASLIGVLTGKAPGSSSAAPHSLKVPLTFANGMLSIGPLRTPVALQPLY